MVTAKWSEPYFESYPDKTVIRGIFGSKCADPMELCKEHVIPSQFVSEYESFWRNSEIPDPLAETDLEDQSEESS